MDRILIFFSIICAFAVLCQWFVVTRVRRYWFQRYERISRKTAYTILAVLGLLNALCVRVAINSELLPLDTRAGKIAVWLFFSYLGCVLMLSLFFLVLGMAYHALRLKDALSTSKGVALPEERVICGERGCVQTGASAAQRESEIQRPADLGSMAGHDSADHAASDPAVPSGTGRYQTPLTTRRAFLKWTTAAGVVAVSGFAVEGVAEGYAAPQVPQFNVPHPALAGLERPLTVVHITDFHFGMFMGTGELERLIRMSNAIEADAVFMTGDIFHSPMTPVEQATPILAKIRPRLLGNFAVLGNHDFYAGVLRSVRSLQQSGWTVLRNEWVTFTRGSVQIHLGGIDDPMVNWAWGKDFPNFPLFIDRQPRSPGFSVLLSHRPTVLPSAAKSGIHFVLSGHTHGGQIVLPVPGMDRGLSVASMASPYTYGWYQEHRTRMYLSRGCGLTFLPWRINCPPEITVFRLSAPDSV